MYIFLFRNNLGIFFDLLRRRSLCQMFFRIQRLHFFFSNLSGVIALKRTLSLSFYSFFCYVLDGNFSMGFFENIAIPKYLIKIKIFTIINILIKYFSRNFLSS